MRALFLDLQRCPRARRGSRSRLSADVEKSDLVNGRVDQCAMIGFLGHIPPKARIDCVSSACVVCRVTRILGWMQTPCLGTNLLIWAMCMLDRRSRVLRPIW